MANEQTGKDVTVIAPPRIPYPAIVKEKYDLDEGAWRVLVEAIFPLAVTAEAVIMAIEYCKSKKYDIMKKMVHIVPIWHSTLKKKVETVWPGIAELRTTAFRTGAYAGKDPTAFGPVSLVRFQDGSSLNVPEFAQITVYRVINGERYPFPGPTCTWLECYSTASHDSDVPNIKWRKSPKYMIEKVSEAAALRVAFPEELGDTEAVEEAPSFFVDTPNGARVEVMEPAKPNREQAKEAAKKKPAATLVSVQGEPVEIATFREFRDVMERLLREGLADAGPQGVDGVWESNGDVIEKINKKFPQVIEEITRLRHELTKAGEAQGDPQQANSEQAQPKQQAPGGEKPADSAWDRPNSGAQASAQDAAPETAKTTPAEPEGPAGWWDEGSYQVDPKKAGRGGYDWEGWQSIMQTRANECVLAKNEPRLRRLMGDNEAWLEKMEASEGMLAGILKQHFREALEQIREVAT